MIEWRSRMMRCIPVFFLYAVLRLCAAQDQNCVGSYDHGQTTYEVHAPNFNTSHCHHEWTNATDFVLANSVAKDQSVLLNNLTTLVTSKCIEVVNYKCDCESEEVIYKCTISMNCPNTLKDQNTTASHHLKVALFIVGGLLFIIIIVIVITRACRRWRAKRERELRMLADTTDSL